MGTNRYSVKVTKRGQTAVTILDSYASKKEADNRANSWRAIGFTAEVLDNKKAKYVIETCPECGEENIWINLDPVSCNYTAVCQHCGEKLMLCDECLSAEDNPYQECNWCECKDCKIGKCFRSIHKN